MNSVAEFVVGKFLLIFISLVLLIFFNWNNITISSWKSSPNDLSVEQANQNRHKRSVLIQDDDLHNYICWKHGRGSLSPNFFNRNEKCTDPTMIKRDTSDCSKYMVCAPSSKADHFQEYYCQCEKSQTFSLLEKICTEKNTDCPTAAADVQYNLRISEFLETPSTGSIRLAGKISPEFSSECQFAGKFLLKYSCDHYIQCLPGPPGTLEAFVHECPPQKHFSKNYRTCMHPHLARCPYNSKESPTYVSTSSTPQIATTLTYISPSRVVNEGPSTMAGGTTPGLPVYEIVDSTTMEATGYTRNASTNDPTLTVVSYNNYTTDTAQIPITGGYISSDTIPTEVATKLASNPAYLNRRNRTDKFHYIDQVMPTYEDYDPAIGNKRDPSKVLGESRPPFLDNSTTYKDETPPQYHDPGHEILKELYQYYGKNSPAYLDAPHGSSSGGNTGDPSAGATDKKHLFKHLTFNHKDMEPRYDPREDLHDNETTTAYLSNLHYDNLEPPSYVEVVPVYNPEE